MQTQLRFSTQNSADAFEFADQEHPSEIIRDISSRRHPNGHVIVFANEKGGVGKSTLAFHCSIALANAGKSVAAIDLDRRQQTLNSALTSREGTARYLKVELPCPKHVTLNEHSGAHLIQEIARVGSDCDFIVIDTLGHDCPIARRAIALADTLVTPVNCSMVDLSLLGKFDPVTMRLKAPGPFAQLVEALRGERAQLGKPELNWIVLKNRSRGSERTQQGRIDIALQTLSSGLNFQVRQGLNERVAYRELFLYGLTQLDTQFLPFPAKTRRYVEQELHALIAGLSLPASPLRKCVASHKFKTPISRRFAEDFIASLFEHAGKNVQAYS
jgi:chromosome partitioning protein